MEKMDIIRDDSLPSGWFKGLDPTYNRAYYYNKRTRRSTWTKPQNGSDDDEESKKFLSAKVVVEKKKNGQYVRAPGRLKNGNSAEISSTSTNSTSSGLSSKDEVEAQIVYVVKQPSEEGKKKTRKTWIEVYSPEHKRTYYFNRQTKESRWTKPIEMEENKQDKPQVVSTKASESMPQPFMPPPPINNENASQVPALQSAWKEIENARKELQKEREIHTSRMKGEWKVLQAQIQQMRDLSLDTSFTPESTPKDMKQFEKAAKKAAIPTPIIVAAMPSIDTSGQTATLFSGGDIVDEKLKNEEEIKIDDYDDPEVRKAKMRAKLLKKKQESLATTTTLGSEEGEELEDDYYDDDDDDDDHGVYTAGLLSELEDYADSLMRRRESISKLQSPTRRASLMKREESNRILRAARKAKKENGDSDSDSDDDEFDKEGYVARFLEGLDDPNAKAQSAADVETMIPYAIEVEMKDVDDAFQAVKAEAEAVGKAHDAYRELEEGCFYSLLEVNPDATPVQLKRAYHKMQMKWHPDKYQGSEKEVANKKSSQISQAYQVLSNEWERALYDRMGLDQYLVHSNVIQCFINYLVTGTNVRKHGRKKYAKYSPFKFIDRQNVKRRVFWLSTDHQTLNCAKKRNLEPTEEDLLQIKSVKISDVTSISKGIKTEVLAKSGALRREHKYLSVHTAERTLDLETTDFKNREFLYSRLTLLVIHLQKSLEWFDAFYEERNPKKSKKKKKKKKRVNKPKPSPKPQEANNEKAEEEEY